MPSDETLSQMLPQISRRYLPCAKELPAQLLAPNSGTHSPSGYPFKVPGRPLTEADYRKGVEDGGFTGPLFLHTVRANSCPMQRDRAAPRIEAPATRPEGAKLQEAARHGDILQEMDHMVLIAELRCATIAVAMHHSGRTIPVRRV